MLSCIFFFWGKYNYFNRRLAAIHSFNSIAYFSDTNNCSHLLLLSYCVKLQWGRGAIKYHPLFQEQCLFCIHYQVLSQNLLFFWAATFSKQTSWSSYIFRTAASLKLLLFWEKVFSLKTWFSEAATSF